jgi:hypothetical protein
MGKGPSKGRSFDWIPNHLQDANGEIAPRPMLNLFALAAEDENKHRRASPALLLSPESLRLAIEAVSARRIDELKEEYKWLTQVHPRLSGQHVPMERETMAKLLQDIPWEVEQARYTSAMPDRLIADLLQIGVFRLTSDGRIHVPDIYLYGFGMKRRGGIRRPKQ